jgi:hypothetical protein
LETFDAARPLSFFVCRLDAVSALNKQFDKRPEDKARVLAHKGSTHGLVLIEQFFVKLVRVPAYELKLIYLKFREEAPTQLERMRKHIVDLLESIDATNNYRAFFISSVYSTIASRANRSPDCISILFSPFFRRAQRNRTPPSLIYSVISSKNSIPIC